MQISQVMMSYGQPNFDQIWWEKMSQPIFMCSTIQAKTFCYHDNILGSRPLQYKGLFWPPLTFYIWYLLIRPCMEEGVVVSWLVRSTPEWAVQVRALAGDMVLCSWARHFTPTVPLSTQVYKQVWANCWGNLTNCGEGTCYGLASHPGEVGILLAASCYRNQDKLQQLWASLGSGSKTSLFMDNPLSLQIY